MTKLTPPPLPFPALTIEPVEIAANCEAIWMAAPMGKAWMMIAAYFCYRRELMEENQCPTTKD